MTIQEALQEAKDTCRECLTVNDCVKEECRWHWIIKALAKQIPKKPYKCDHRMWCDTCDNCLSFETEKGFPHCMMCGQAIDWSDTE